MSDSSRLSKRIAFLKSQAPEPPPETPQIELPGWDRVGEYLFSRAVRFPGAAVRSWPRETAPEGREPEELLFFDTETTGLSGGAGSVIFLMGTARCEDGDLVLEQLFLSDFPGEAEFLEAIKEKFSGFGAFVSYNGKAFDSRLLATRFIVNRIDFRMGYQIDLLHMARRLWRPITGDCTLRTVESRILGITRDIDVAGEEIPGIYLDFLRSGRLGLLPVVFQHNLTDVTSLARIWDAFGRFFSGDLEAAPVDERALGTMLLERESEAGATILAEAFTRGRLDAGIPLSIRCKRRGLWEEAVGIWTVMADSGNSVFAALELAKYHEHRGRDVRRALESVELLLSWNLPLGHAARREVQKRKARLERKLKEKEAPSRRAKRRKEQ
jgi:uncharacterized protein YprB with RNaseH-like and TPR domain